MDKSQSDAVVQAVLAPNFKAQKDLRQQQAREAWWLSEKRRVAWLGLIGFAIGAVVATYIGQRFTTGGLLGGLGGGAVGWLWIGLRSRRRAT